MAARTTSTRRRRKSQPTPKRKGAAGPNKQPPAQARRFGEVATGLGLLHPDDLQQVLELQESLRRCGIGSPPLGVVLLELGYMTRRQVEQVLGVLEDQRLVE